MRTACAGDGGRAESLGTSATGDTVCIGSRGNRDIDRFHAREGTAPVCVLKRSVWQHLAERASG